MGMASNNNRLQPSGHLNVTGHYNNRRSPSPSTSRPVPPDPGSPGPVEETASDYFNPLSQAPSAQSQTSLSSFPRFPSQTSLSAFPSYQESNYSQQQQQTRRRPPVDQARQPSIRIRRNSNGSVYSNHSVTSQFDGFSDDGRPRSISQPERVRVSDGLARHSRRVPQVAMPRLTEEGGRPSLAELGISDDQSAPLSPTASLPDENTNGRGGLGRLRRASRFIWPGHRRQSGEDQAVPMGQRDDDRRDDEYDQELVDWLDVIGKDIHIHAIYTIKSNNHRPRSPNPFNTHKRPKLALRSRSRKMGQPSTDIRSVPTRSPSRLGTRRR